MFVEHLLCARCFTRIIYLGFLQPYCSLYLTGDRLRKTVKLSLVTS